MAPEAFSYRENRMTDGSVIYEVYQRGSDQRLASAADPNAASILTTALNSAIDQWARSNVNNTVDC